MIEFEKLSDDEFAEYTKSIQTGSENTNIRKKIKSYLSDIENGLQKNILSIKKIEKKLEDGEEDTTDWFNQLSNIARAINSKANNLHDILTDFGMQFPEEEIKNLCEIRDIKIKFKSYDRTLIIDLPELLPHRPTYDVSRRSMRYYYDAAAWKTEYEAAFRKEFEHGKFKIYGEKVCLIFLHHFDKKKKIVPDTDNLDTKPIIDIITLYLLRDDSYEYISHYIDAVEDDKSYTEIIVCPLSELHNYI